jgi:hypothetical protein
MPDWTKTSFDELRDVCPKDVQVQRRFAREALRSSELGVSRFTVVVAGSGRAKPDDEVVELSVDVLRIAPAGIRSFEAAREV